MLSTPMRRVVGIWTLFVLVFLYAPLLLVVVNAFNSSKTFAFPPSGLTLRWWADAWNSSGMWKSLGNSVVVGLCATVIALTLGTMAAFAVQRHRFFGRQTISFLVVLPITLPGIVTGIAAGSIFTFSLSLGDYIAVTIVGGKTQMLGNIIYGQLVTANDQPLAAALSLIPLAAIVLYLLAMRRTGALENV